MDYQSYINANMLYQTNESEANELELSFDLDEFITQYTMSSETYQHPISFDSEPEPEIQSVQPGYWNEMTPQIWSNKGCEWMMNTTNFEAPMEEDLSLTAAQTNLPFSSNVFITFEDFEDFEKLYTPSTSQNPTPGSSSSSITSTLSESSSPTYTPEPTSSHQSPETRSPQPSSSSSSSSESTFTCDFCSRSFAKKHELNRHTNQHTKPITCPIPHCTHRTAKTRDMKRHVFVHHAEQAPVKAPRFICPVGGCRFSEMAGEGGKERGFKRRDHLVRHVRMVHPGVGV